MTTRPQPDRSALGRLVERIREVEARGGGESGALTTGWASVDSVLPQGGLRRDATHEVVSGDVERSATPSMGRAAWEPPIALLRHFAVVNAASEGWTVWIGRRVWPYGPALGALAITRTLCIDPPDLGARDWVLDAALRCPGLVVVADASRLDAAASRRVQLAAEAGGSVGFLARPSWERGEISFASSRWLVAPVPQDLGEGRTEVVSSRWVVTLDRCKGLRRCDSQQWIVERDARGGVLTLASEVAHGPRAAVAAS